MSRLIIRYYSICIFLYAPYFINAQTIEQADSLFLMGDYMKARVTYERLLFEKKEATDLLLLKKSYCLKAQQKYQEAYKTLKRSDIFSVSDSLKSAMYHERIVNSYLATKYDLCLSEIQEMRYYLATITNPAIDIIEILCLNNLQQWDKAEESFLKFQSANNGMKNNPYGAIKNYKFKNPDKAETLSFIFPGVGQIYAGNLGRGITSMLAQAGLITFAVYNFYNGFYFSGAFTGVGLFYMFYNGGARHARYLAEEHNKTKIADFNSEVKKLLVIVK